MEKWLEKLKGERAFVMQGVASLLLLLTTILVSSTSRGLPEENGIISAAICIAIIVFVNIALTLAKEGVEGIFFALVGSFMAGVAVVIAGSRLAFDPSINSYFLASLALSSILSISSNLYLIPERFDVARTKLRNLGFWVFVTLAAIAVNFVIMYWVPKII
ncbi:MAG: hypothetical protein QXU02_03150 [Candidatus Bathyarchaeia archaeon]